MYPLVPTQGSLFYSGGVFNYYPGVLLDYHKQQRLAIAQAIMEKPDILVLDEPTNSLDENGVQLVRKILMEERARGATILIATHNKEDLIILSDINYHVNDGTVSLFQKNL